MKALAVCLFLMSGAASADVSSADAAGDAAILREAAKMTSYEIPAGASMLIQPVTAQWMGERACPKNPTRCHVLGLYDDKDVIYLLDTLSGPMRDHVLFHEMVHWLQHHSGKYSLSSCNDTVMREREAYMMQNAYIVLVQHGPLFSPIPPMSCPEGA